MDGLILIWMGMTNNIWVAYIGYLLYRSLFQMLITVARYGISFEGESFSHFSHYAFSFEVARNIKNDSYGLVFGVNTFLALLFQTLLTVIVVEYLEMEPKGQFVVYGGFCIAIGLLYLILFVGSLCRKNGCEAFKDEYRKRGLWINDNANETKSVTDVVLDEEETTVPLNASTTCS